MTTPPPLERIRNPHDRGFSAATVVPVGTGSLVFVSGEIGRVPGAGRLVEGDFEAEARQCFANLNDALARAGAAFADVVKLTTYLADLSSYAVYAKVRNEFVGEDWPASTAVGTANLLLGAGVEVDAIAFVPTGRHPA